MKKTKILHISKYYPPFIGGIEQVAYNVVTAIKSLKEYEQRIICFNDNNKTILNDTYEDILVTRIGSKRKIASQSLNLEYGKILEQTFLGFNPDIICFHYPNPFASYFLLKLMKKYKFNGKLVLYWHCDIIKQKILKKFFNNQNEKLCKRANAIIATSPSYLNDTDYLPRYKDKVKIVPLCIGNERLNITTEQKIKANQIKEKYNKKIIFFFGRHTEYKGLRYLIESDKYLRQEECQIIIGGKGELTEHLKKQAAIYKNIEFVGKLSDDDVNSYLMACDIFAFPSITRNEAFGISLAEAMYFGKPTCTFTIKGSGVNWVSLNNVTGLEAPNRNVKAYADNLKKIMYDEALYERLSEASKQRCYDLFTYKKFNEKVKNIYSLILTND